MKIIGYDTFISILKAAYGLRLAGVPSSHVLVVAPPGTAKTTTVKLFAKSVKSTFVRTTGRYDMLPEDFISEKEVTYVDGRPEIVWRLRVVGKLLRESNPVPAVWFFDEIDKMNRKSMFSLLELMEEQQVTLPTGETYPLNFMLVGAGNSRRYDRDSNPIPRSVRDRFIAYWELGYLPTEKEVEVLSEGIKYLMGEDTEPSDQFRFSFRVQDFKSFLGRVEREYGECVVKAVTHLRSHKSVDEPPGPRAYIHAILLASSLAAVEGRLSPADVGLAFQAAVAGKITVSGDESPFSLCHEAFERYCGGRQADSGKEVREFFRGGKLRENIAEDTHRLWRSP